MGETRVTLAMRDGFVEKESKSFFNIAARRYHSDSWKIPSYEGYETRMKKFIQVSIYFFPSFIAGNSFWGPIKVQRLDIPHRF